MVEEEAASTSDMFVVLSDVWLDRESTFARLRTVFEGFDSLDAIPSMFVLMGDFSSQPFGPTRFGFGDYAKGFDKLAELVREFPRLRQEARWVIVPGPGDPGVSSALPRPPLMPSLTESLREALPRATFASNPARVRYRSQDLVFMREDLQSRMRRNCILPPTEIEDAPAEKAARARARAKALARQARLERNEARAERRAAARAEKLRGGKGGVKGGVVGGGGAGSGDENAEPNGATAEDLFDAVMEEADGGADVDADVDADGDDGEEIVSDDELSEGGGGGRRGGVGVGEPPAVSPPRRDSRAAGASRAPANRAASGVLGTRPRAPPLSRAALRRARGQDRAAGAGEVRGHRAGQPGLFRRRRIVRGVSAGDEEVEFSAV